MQSTRSLTLAGTFHTDRLRKPGSQMDAALAHIFHTGSSRGAANPDAETTGSRETAVETALALTRIFHTKSITACGKLIITALVSNCDLDSRDSYIPASKYSPA